MVRHSLFWKNRFSRFRSEHRTLPNAFVGVRPYAPRLSKQVGKRTELRAIRASWRAPLIFWQSLRRRERDHVLLLLFSLAGCEVLGRSLDPGMLQPHGSEQ